MRSFEAENFVKGGRDRGLLWACVIEFVAKDTQGGNGASLPVRREAGAHAACPVYGGQFFVRFCS